MKKILFGVGRLYKIALHHRYGFSLCIYLGAAALTGIACVLFMRGYEFVYAHRLNAEHIGLWCWLTTPILFLISIEFIRRVAPCADGAGIPQTIFAAKHLNDSNFKNLYPLVSFRTMSVKVAALLIGLWAGASTGREGPTVHIAACLFFGIALFLHRLFKIQFNMRSAVVAGGAAGLAAAFNTPLAGVTFAIEELTSESFAGIKDMVLMAIIVAGLAAKTLTGEYVYFGRLHEPAVVSVLMIIMVGVMGGLGGTLFSTLLIGGRRRLVTIKGWKKYISIALLAWAVLLVATLSGMKGIAGPGNIAAQNYLRGHVDNPPGLFLIFKMAATLFTYWSGIAGGIFAPCLSMGSSIGAWVATWQNGPIGACALMGMAAFLAGAIQAPITSFVIIFEMTNQHQMILPIMLASLIGYMITRICRAKHLYQTLAGFYEGMLSVPDGA
jgi:H+/Cl- antiporter ClcA